MKEYIIIISLFISESGLHVCVGVGWGGGRTVMDDCPSNSESMSGVGGGEVAHGKRGRLHMG